MGSHTGVRFAEEIDKFLTDNHLETKVSYITTDNASNMKMAFDVLKELQEESTSADGAEADGEEADDGVLDDDRRWEDHDNEEGVDVPQAIDRHCTSRLACFAHTLQLMVKDGLIKMTSKSVRFLNAKCTKLSNLIHNKVKFSVILLR